MSRYTVAVLCMQRKGDFSDSVQYMTGMLLGGVNLPGMLQAGVYIPHASG